MNLSGLATLAAMQQPAALRNVNPALIEMTASKAAKASLSMDPAVKKLPRWIP